jgi:hypothetical protein
MNSAKTTLALSLFATLASSAVRSQDAGDYRLLAVGVNRYEHKRISDLNGCVADAKAFAQLLGTLRADQKLLLDEQATRQQVLAELKALAKTADPERLTFALLSGHGSRRRGEWYFIPHDFDPDRPQDTAVSGSEILAELEPAIRRGCRVVLVLDACHAGQIRLTAEIKGLLAPVIKGGPDRGGLVLLASSIPVQFSMDSAAGSDFTRALTQALRGEADQDQDGAVTYREIVRHLNHSVKRIATERYKFPGLAWPEQDVVCDLSPTLAERFTLRRVPKEHRYKPTYGVIGDLLDRNKLIAPHPSEFAFLYEPRKLAKGEPERVRGVWYWERVGAKIDGTRWKDAYALELDDRGAYRTQFWPAFGAPQRGAGLYIAEAGKPLELDIGNSYDVLSVMQLGKDDLTFEHRRAYGGELEGERGNRAYTLRRVKDWKEAEELVSGPRKANRRASE